MARPRLRAAALALATSVPGAGARAAPDHPVITEVFRDAPPTGTSVGDGPVSKDPAYPHAEYVEIYLPEAAQLAAGLNRDSRGLTFYVIEGDITSSGVGTVDFRIDLPPFDLDPGNGTTPGAVPRPESGVVVIGWIDYAGGNPPSGLAGTPSTRIALIQGGTTSTSGFTFVALNGNHFDGTINFPVPVGVSTLNTSQNGHPYTGILEQGSSAYLLVNRNAAGYQSVDRGGAVDLPTNTALLESLLDALAGNDDPAFDPGLQPCGNPAAIDLSTLLPCGGVFTPFVPQVAEDLHGYARRYLDLAKTTEGGGEPDPAADSGLYRTIAALGPFGPSPGVVHFTTSPAELEVALAGRQSFEVLAGTTGRPAVFATNRGGSFALSATATPGPGTLAGVAYASDGPSAPAFGGASVHPRVAVSAAASVPHGATDTITVGVIATGQDGDPAVANPVATVEASYRILAPTSGQDAAGQPFQATAIAAIQGLPAPAVGANELAATSLAAFLAAQLGGAAAADPGNGANGRVLIDPATDLGDPSVIGPMLARMPTDPLQYIDATDVPAGAETLVQTVLGSAEVASGATTYGASFDADRTRVRAVRLDLPPTRTKGGSFVPSERVHFVDASGRAGDPNSGLSEADTTRGFEVAIVDTNLGPTGAIEWGSADDFGVVVRARGVRAGSPIRPGELVFLGFTGGREGADVDTLNVLPHQNRTVLFYLDLDALDDVLGVESVGPLWLVDASGTGEVDAIEAFSLATAAVDGDGDTVPDAFDNCAQAANASQLDTNSDGFGNACDADYDDDGRVGGSDYLSLGRAFGTTRGDPRYDPEIDSTGDGAIGGPEYLILGRSWAGGPGPSGLACAGTVPCP
jgi:hypothetical protein